MVVTGGHKKLHVYCSNVSGKKVKKFWKIQEKIRDFWQEQNVETMRKEKPHSYLSYYGDYPCKETDKHD